MFTLTAPSPRSLRRLLTRSVFTLTVLLCLSLFVGCKTEPDKPGLLTGSWQTEYDGYDIDLNEKTLSYNDGGYGYEFEGTIEEITYFNAEETTGVIYVKYISVGTKLDSSLVGKFIAVYFRGLTDSGADITTAMEGTNNPATATLDEAKNKFTEDTMGDYTAFWSTCTRK